MVFLSNQVKMYLDILYRRRWWVVVPVVLSAILGVMVLERMPKIYRAATTILVVRQKVPENFVRSTVTTGIEERMASLQVQILSRSYLENVVREFGIVPENATDAQIERACRAVKRMVTIAYDARQYSYFQIMVEDGNPERAAGIANRLAELFIEQNTQLRQEEASRTLEQMMTWLAQSQSDLNALESRIAAYRQLNMWELPEHLNTNISLLQAAQQRLGTLTNDIQLRGQRLDALQAQAQVPTGPEGVPLAPGDARTPELARLAALQAELAQLRLDYTDEHPTVRRKQEEIAEYKRLHPELTAAPEPQEGETPAPVGIHAAIAGLQAEIRTLEAEREEALSQIRTYQRRISNAPRREQELAELTRDLDALQRAHEGLLTKKQEAERARDLEAAKRGEQFQVQDLARTPSQPFRPNPSSVIGMFLFGGLGAGLAIVMLFEVIDQSIRTEHEFRHAFPDIPLLVTMPNLKEAQPKRRKFALRRHRRRAAS